MPFYSSAGSASSAQPIGCSTMHLSIPFAARAYGSSRRTEAGCLTATTTCPRVGHCHPRVVEALGRQAALLNTPTRYMHETVLDYAERLLATMPAEIGNVMFTCTGSEANDLAVRVARSVTGNTGFVVTANDYHGVTATVAEMSPSLGAAVALGAYVRTVPVPDVYRDGASGAAATFTRAVEAAIASLAEAGMRPAALLFDTVFASDGVALDPPGFVAGAAAAVRAAGGLYIADEVQAGLARTGSHMWASSATASCWTS